jgi:N-acyl-D-aspartate/D-glutamate deacylase
VVFEEFGAGRAALHLQDQLQRNELLNDEAYRRWFRADFDKKFSPRVWHRDFHDAEILDCPDASVIGKTIADVAEDRGIHVVDAFLDLVVEHGKNLRWRTTVANHRPEKLNTFARQPGIQIGFSDSGAHLRNMAFYNFGVRFLKRVNDASIAGQPFLSVEAAVHKLTGDLADWFGLDAGHLRVGDRADIAIIDPAALDARVDGYAEAEMPAFEGLRRMVNRNDETVVATLVNGEVVWGAGLVVYTSGPGRFLRAGGAPMPERQRARATAAA